MSNIEMLRKQIAEFASNEEIDNFKENQQKKLQKEYAENQEEKIKNIEKKASKYQEDVEDNTGIPHHMKDLLEISYDAQKKYDEIHLKMKIVDVLLCVFCVGIIFCAYYDNQLISSSFNVLSQTYNSSDMNLNYRIALIILDLVTVFMILMRYTYLLEIHKLKLGKIADKDDIMSTGLIWNLIIEVFLNIMFIPPVYDNYFQIEGNICRKL